MKKTFCLILCVLISAAALAGNPVDHFAVSLGGQPGVNAGTPVTLDIAAYDSGNAIISDYAGTVTLTASVGDVYVVETRSNTISGFSSGQWSGNMELFGAASTVTLTATDNAVYSAAGRIIFP
jgi:hypothetical protein